MPRRILLMRHAKSSWDDPSLPDHDRPLNARGRRSATAIGTYLREHDLVPELLLCSSATRATQTMSGMALVGADVRIRDDLYGADDDSLLAAIRETPEEVSSVAVLAHDPGVNDLGRRLAVGGSGPSTDALRERFPTGAVAVFEHDAPWRDLEMATLVAFVRPRDLA
jgi:phosphohistidine phosphatase